MKFNSGHVPTPVWISLDLFVVIFSNTMFSLFQMAYPPKALLKH